MKRKVAMKDNKSYNDHLKHDFFEVLYLFIPWTYKPDNDHLNTYISSSVVCVINRQNIILKYGMRGHFRYSYVCDIRLKWVLHVIATDPGTITMIQRVGFAFRESGLF